MPSWLYQSTLRKSGPLLDIETILIAISRVKTDLIRLLYSAANTEPNQTSTLIWGKWKGESINPLKKVVFKRMS
ncbi:hypothetical protein FOT55_10035 [Serratia bockelmannii]|nr:hypothetical protein FOT55_10035 [Serratia bockelmannii]